MVDALSGGALEQAPRWDLVDTESCGGGNRVSWCSWKFSGYMGIYRRKKYVGGAARGPRGWAARLQPLGTPLPRGLLASFLTATPSLMDHVCSENNSPEGFIPFGLRLIFLFFEALK